MVEIDAEEYSFLTIQNSSSFRKSETKDRYMSKICDNLLDCVASKEMCSIQQDVLQFAREPTFVLAHEMNGTEE